MPVKSISHVASALCFNLDQTIRNKVTGICWSHPDKSKYLRRLKKPGLDYSASLNYALELTVTKPRINLLVALQQTFETSYQFSVDCFSEIYSLISSLDVVSSYKREEIKRHVK